MFWTLSFLVFSESLLLCFFLFLPAFSTFPALLAPSHQHMLFTTLPLKKQTATQEPLLGPDTHLLATILFPFLSRLNVLKRHDL